MSLDVAQLLQACGIHPSYSALYSSASSSFPSSRAAPFAASADPLCSRDIGVVGVLQRSSNPLLSCPSPLLLLQLSSRLFSLLQEVMTPSARVILKWSNSKFQFPVLHHSAFLRRLFPFYIPSFLCKGGVEPHLWHLRWSNCPTPPLILQCQGCFLSSMFPLIFTCSPLFSHSFLSGIVFLSNCFSSSAFCFISLPFSLPVVMTPSSRMMLEWSNCPRMPASLRKERRCLSEQPALNVFMATGSSLLLGSFRQPRHTSPKSPVGGDRLSEVMILYWSVNDQQEWRKNKTSVAS